MSKKYLLILLCLTALLPLLIVPHQLANARNSVALSSKESLALAADPPQPIPDDCDGVAPEPDPCCAYGYVYANGLAVANAVVRVQSASGELNIVTSTQNGTDAYFAVDLGSSPLSVQTGETITLTATYDKSSTSISYQVASGSQQVDIVLPRQYDDWPARYFYRANIPITTPYTLTAGTLVKVDGLNFDTLVAAGKTRSDHNDLRVFRKAGATSWQEIARVYYSHRDLEFRLAVDMPAGTDRSYYLYYGDPDAGTPPTFSLPQGWFADMYTEKWWPDQYLSGTWIFDTAMDFNDVCESPYDHDGHTQGTRFDESDRRSGRLWIPYGGNWTFHLFVQDGYRVAIAGSEIAHDDGYADSRWVNIGPIYLEAGWHLMELGHSWVNCGAWRFAMEGPSFPNQIIPAQFFQQVDETVKTWVAPADEEMLNSLHPPIATIHSVYPQKCRTGSTHPPAARFCCG